MNILSRPLADVQSAGSRLLRQAAFSEIILFLRAALPPPLADEPAEWVARDEVAIGAVAGLAPATVAEGRLAAQFVAADAYAMDCLRLAQEARWDPDAARKCAAQAMAMMRESKSAMRVLLRMQAARHKVAENEAAAEPAARVEHEAGELMIAALAAAPAMIRGAERRGITVGDVRNWNRFRMTR